VGVGKQGTYCCMKGQACKHASHETDICIQHNITTMWSIQITVKARKTSRCTTKHLYQKENDGGLQRWPFNLQDGCGVVFHKMGCSQSKKNLTALLKNFDLFIKVYIQCNSPLSNYASFQLPAFCPVPMLSAGICATKHKIVCCFVDL